MSVRLNVVGSEIEFLNINHVRQSLEKLAEWDVDRVNWKGWTVYRVPESKVQRWIFEIFKHIPKLRDWLYGEKNLQKKEVQEILNALRPIADAENRDLYALFTRAVRNYSEVCPKHKPAPVNVYRKDYKVPPFEIPKMELTLDVKEEEVLTGSFLNVKRTPESPEELRLDISKQEIRGVKVNGEELSRDDYVVTKNELILKKTPKNKEFTVEVESKISVFDNGSGQGVYGAGNAILSQLETEGFRNVWCGLDRPDVWSVATVHIIADPKKYPTMLSNGKELSSEDLSDGRVKKTFSDPNPTRPYLLAVVLGDLNCIKDTYTSISGDVIPLEVWATPGEEENCRYSLEALKKSLHYMEHELGLVCPNKILRMVAANRFNAGAMENVTLMIFNIARLLLDPAVSEDSDYRGTAHTVAHELVHHWFGNKVGVNKWFETSLKEALTDMISYQITESLFSEAYMRPEVVASLKSRGYAAVRGANRHPLCAEKYVAPWELYNAITYTYGREIFRMLYILAENEREGLYKEILQEYVRRYAYKSVDFLDLLNVIEELSSIDRKSFERWFYQNGNPHVDFDLEYDEEEQIARLHVHQECPDKDQEDQGPCTIPLFVELIGEGGKILSEKELHLVKETDTVIEFKNVTERPTPAVLHGQSAPVTHSIDYSEEDMLRLIEFCDDPVIRSQTIQEFSLKNLREIYRAEVEGEEIDDKKLDRYLEVLKKFLKSDSLPYLFKSELLSLPGISKILSEETTFDYQLADRVRCGLQETIASSARKEIQALSKKIAPTVENSYKGLTEGEMMEVRELNHICSYYEHLDSSQASSRGAREEGIITDLEDGREMIPHVRMLLNLQKEEAEEALENLYKRCTGSEHRMTTWFRLQATARGCTAEKIKALSEHPEFNWENPNMLRGLFGVFSFNLASYFDPKGKGVDVVMEAICKADTFNPTVAAGYLASVAFRNYERAPAERQKQMKQALIKMRDGNGSKELRSFARKVLEAHEV